MSAGTVSKKCVSNVCVSNACVSNARTTNACFVDSYTVACGVHNSGGGATLRMLVYSQNSKVQQHLSYLEQKFSMFFNC